MVLTVRASLRGLLAAIAFVPFTAFSVTACDDGAPALPVEGSGDATALLRYVNYAGTTRTMLRSDAGLSARQAEALLAYRDGGDGAPGGGDDDRFDTVRELSLVVPVEAVHALLLHALENEWLDADPFLGRWDHVSFTLSEADAVLAAANAASRDELDDDAGLNAGVVDGIVAARPLHSVEAWARSTWASSSGTP
jgi:hypothetical protein